MVDINDFNLFDLVGLGDATGLEWIFGISSKWSKNDHIELSYVVKNHGFGVWTSDLGSHVKGAVRGACL